MRSNERMDESGAERMHSQGMVASTKGESNRTLPVLRSERQLRHDGPLPQRNAQAGDEMAEPAQSKGTV